MREVASVEARRLVVPRHQHSGVAVDLRIDLLVRELVDLVRTGCRLEERLPVQLAGGSLQRELGREQLLEPVHVVLGHRACELMLELDELVGDGDAHPASILSGAPVSPNV